MEYYAKSAAKSLSDDEKSEIVKKIKSAIEIVEDNLTQSEKTAIDNSIDEFINITEKGPWRTLSFWSTRKRTGYVKTAS